MRTRRRAPVRLNDAEAMRCARRGIRTDEIRDRPPSVYWTHTILGSHGTDAGRRNPSVPSLEYVVGGSMSRELFLARGLIETAIDPYASPWESEEAASRLTAFVNRFRPSGERSGYPVH